MKLLIATKNRNKYTEIAHIFTLPNLTISCAADLPKAPEVAEDGITFKQNAVKKAVTFSVLTGMWTLADDSGLEVPALQNQPGVFSARYAGENATYRDNNNKLLENLKQINSRKAQFRCVIALASPSGKAQTAEGVCRGTIITQPKGNNGFGYDPLFVPDGYSQTFAELDSQVKNSISHRAKALKNAYKLWKPILESDHPPDWPELNQGIV
jgi:XTP/dITP diphosphohydrolase